VVLWGKHWKSSNSSTDQPCSTAMWDYQRAIQIISDKERNKSIMKQWRATWFNCVKWNTSQDILILNESKTLELPNIAQQITRWCPPRFKLAIIPLTFYRYITNKNPSEIGVINQLNAIVAGGTRCGDEAASHLPKVISRSADDSPWRRKAHPLGKSTLALIFGTLFPWFFLGVVGI